MSDDWLILVPVDAQAAPPPAATERARALLAEALPRADEVTVEYAAHPTFVDAGEHFQAVRCPRCGADATSWWSEAMDRAHLNGFRDLAIVTPCCSAATTLNDLDYDWPQAFARVRIQATNPDVIALDEPVKHAVEAVLGVPVRVVRRRI